MALEEVKLIIHYVGTLKSLDIFKRTHTYDLRTLYVPMAGIRFYWTHEEKRVYNIITYVFTDVNC